MCTSVAAVQMSQPLYLVGEGDPSVEVCAQLTLLPAGGLECDIAVDMELTNGLKARKRVYIVSIEQCLKLWVNIVASSEKSNDN